MLQNPWEASGSPLGAWQGEGKGLREDGEMSKGGWRDGWRDGLPRLQIKQHLSKERSAALPGPQQGRWDAITIGPDVQHPNGCTCQK